MRNICDILLQREYDIMPEAILARMFLFSIILWLCDCSHPPTCAGFKSSNKGRTKISLLFFEKIAKCSENRSILSMLYSTSRNLDIVY